MNTPRKIILTVYVLLGIILWIKLVGGSGCGNLNPLQCAFVNIVGGLLVVYILLGIPTLILYKIWKDK